MTGKPEVSEKSMLLDGRAFRCSAVGSKSGDEDAGALDADRTCEQGGADGQDLRKRKRPRIGDEEKLTSTRSLLVLGDDPKPRQRRISEFMNKRRPGSLFNHYANGSGWWDSDMEGVDSEEVGFQETWEGMGSASLGGLQWQDIDL